MPTVASCSSCQRHARAARLARPAHHQLELVDLCAGVPTVMASSSSCRRHARSARLTKPAHHQAEPNDRHLRGARAPSEGFASAAGVPTPAGSLAGVKRALGVDWACHHQVELVVLEADLADQLRPLDLQGRRLLLLLRLEADRAEPLQRIQGSH